MGDEAIVAFRGNLRPPKQLGLQEIKRIISKDCRSLFISVGIKSGIMFYSQTSSQVIRVISQIAAININFPFPHLLASRQLICLLRVGVGLTEESVLNVEV